MKNYVGEGIGVGSVFISAHDFFHIFLSPFLNITDPTPAPPLQGRGVISNGGN